MTKYNTFSFLLLGRNEFLVAVLSPAVVILHHILVTITVQHLLNIYQTK